MVNLFGMMPPSSNASVVTVNLGLVGAGAEGICAIVPAAAETKTIAAIHDFMLHSLRWKSFRRSNLALGRANCK
jgi:hypothetical protein